MQRIASCLVVCLLAGGSAAYAQRGGGDWTTGGFDAQRSSWVRLDAKISPQGMRKPGFDHVWKLNLREGAKTPDPLTPPVLLDFYIGYRGFRTLGFFGNSANTVIGVDTDLARVEWKKTLGPVTAGKGAGCPGGMTSAVVRPTTVDYPLVPQIRGMGRGTPAKSGVGEPHQGAVTLRPAAPPPVPTPPPAAATPGGAPRRAAAAPVNPFAPRAQFVHAVSSDGKFHSMYVSNGEEPKEAIAFIPANANAQGLLLFDNTAYVSTVNGCGGVDNGVWALSLESQKVSQWKAKNKGPVGGPSAGPDGTLYVTDGNEVVALEEKTLKAKGSYAAGAEFTDSPVIFEFKGKDMLAASTRDGQLHVVDTAAMSKAAATARIAAADSSDGGLATWQDGAGTRWILAAAEGTLGAEFPAKNGDVKNGAVVAFKVVDEGGTTKLQPAWSSRDMQAPLTPIIVNGVVFAVAGGKGGAKAVLYALDAETGKELWSSGDKIAGQVRRGGLSAGGTRVYVASQDGTQYAFGFPIEH